MLLKKYYIKYVILRYSIAIREQQCVIFNQEEYLSSDYVNDYRIGRKIDRMNLIKRIKNKTDISLTFGKILLFSIIIALIKFGNCEINININDLIDSLISFIF